MKPLFYFQKRLFSVVYRQVDAIYRRKSMIERDSNNLPYLKATEWNDRALTRAPLGYFYNAPRWGEGYFEPPLISETTGPILKIKPAFEIPGKTVEGNNFFCLGVTSDVTGQVKVKMFYFSGLVTSASKIAMLSSNKANESACIMSLAFVSIIYCAL